MKSTTQSQLAEHAYRDYLRETAPTDNKKAISFVFNTYASRFGLPLVMTATLPQRIAKIYGGAISGLNNMPIRVGNLQSRSTFHEAKPASETTAKAGRGHPC